MSKKKTGKEEIKDKGNVVVELKEKKEKGEKKPKKVKEVVASDVIDAKLAFEMTASTIESKFKNTFHAWLYEKEKLRQYRFSSGSVGLDTALGGEGLPEGRLIEIYGPPSSGKTSLGLEIAWHRQQDALKKRAAGDLSVPAGIVFVDAEHKFDRRLLDNWRGGFHPDHTIFAEPATGEDAFGLMFSYAESAGTALIMLDSVSALQPKDKLKKDDQSTHYGVQAGFIADWLPKLTGAAARTGVPMILINQVRANLKATQYTKNINRYNKGGGYSLKHQVSVSIFFDKTQMGYKKGTKDDSGKFVQEDSQYKGQWSRGTIIRNHSGDTFFNDFDVFLEFGKRFLTAGELLAMGESLGVLKKGGGGNYTIYGQHYRGLDQATEFIDTHPDILKRLWDDVKTMQLVGRVPIVDINDLDEEELIGEEDDGE
jgi:recombination protein RecA